MCTPESIEPDICMIHTDTWRGGKVANTRFWRSLELAHVHMHALHASSGHCTQLPSWQFQEDGQCVNIQPLHHCTQHNCPKIPKLHVHLVTCSCACMYTVCLHTCERCECAYMLHGRSGWDMLRELGVLFVLCLSACKQKGGKVLRANAILHVQAASCFNWWRANTIAARASIYCWLSSSSFFFSSSSSSTSSRNTLEIERQHECRAWVHVIMC